MEKFPKNIHNYSKNNEKVLLFCGLFIEYIRINKG